MSKRISEREGDEVREPVSTKKRGFNYVQDIISYYMTSHLTTSHHITSHHITSHNIMQCHSATYSLLYLIQWFRWHRQVPEESKGQQTEDLGPQILANQMSLKMSKQDNNQVYASNITSKMKHNIIAESRCIINVWFASSDLKESML